MSGRWWCGPALLLVALPVSASGQAAPAVPDRPTMNVAVPRSEPGCDRAVTTEEIVVCGRRVDTTYRLDPRLIEAQRRVGVSGPPSAASRLLVSCSDVSARGCPGQGALSVSGGALKLVSVLVAAVTGDDWKEPLRSSEPDEYQVYRTLKPK